MKIPPALQAKVERHINKVAEEHFKGRYTRLEIRFRSQFCYLDAFIEPSVREDWPPADWPETRNEYVARMRSIPLHLCRLPFFGGDRWGFALFGYSDEKYELTILPSGDFFGTAEEAFLSSAEAYLQS